MKAHTISWSGTFLFTRFLPFVWITGWGIGTLQLLVSPETTIYNGVRGAAPPGLGWLFLLAWIAGSALLLFLAWGLKRVRIRGDALEVSNYLRTVTVPLASVVEVRQRMFPHYGAITLELDHATRFGDRITFIPSERPARWRIEDGPIVKELRTLCGAAPVLPASERSPSYGDRR